MCLLSVHLRFSIFKRLFMYDSVHACFWNSEHLKNGKCSLKPFISLLWPKFYSEDNPIWENVHCFKEMWLIQPHETWWISFISIPSRSKGHRCLLGPVTDMDRPLSHRFLFSATSFLRDIKLLSESTNVKLPLDNLSVLHLLFQPWGLPASGLRQQDWMHGGGLDQARVPLEVNTNAAARNSPGKKTAQKAAIWSLCLALLNSFKQNRKRETHGGWVLDLLKRTMQRRSKVPR